jgi:hypothetical protein
MDFGCEGGTFDVVVKKSLSRGRCCQDVVVIKTLLSRCRCFQEVTVVKLIISL